jgi:hypothetical protein
MHRFLMSRAIQSVPCPPGLPVEVEESQRWAHPRTLRTGYLSL